jgi:hypothetical protein
VQRYNKLLIWAILKSNEKENSPHDSIVGKTNEENYYYLFKEFINNFSNILSTSQKNEEIFYTILKICSNLSIDDKLCEEMIKTGLGYIFYNSLSVPNLERDYVIKLLKIF